MPVDGLFSTTVELLGKSIDLRTKNHNLISANMANAETPGYVPTRLSFEGELKEALESREKGAKLVAAHPRHIPIKGMRRSLDQVQGTLEETPAPNPGRDGNRVELEQEMARMAENQILYNASVQMLAKKFEGLKQAIKGTN